MQGPAGCNGLQPPLQHHWGFLGQMYLYPTLPGTWGMTPHSFQGQEPAPAGSPLPYERQGQAYRQALFPAYRREEGSFLALGFTQE